MATHAGTPIATRGPVLVVGTGLIGSSIGLSLATRGIEVHLADSSPSALALAEHVGAGRAASGDVAPRLVVVAAPPDQCGAIVADALSAHPGAIVTDVASVKVPVLAAVRAAGGDLRRYVGSHPMAGRERSGAIAAQADLFAGRPWVIVPSPEASEEAQLAVRALAVDLGASPLTMTAGQHDRAVALVSHLPQLVASTLAARLLEGEDSALQLAGQGLRDTTRIAGSAPEMWSAIIAANGLEVLPLLRAVRADLDALIQAIDSGELGRSLQAVGTLIERGNEGSRRIPGKHGGARRDFDVLTVLVPDEPGALGRLFVEAGAAGVNLEDVTMEHSPGQPVGLVALAVERGVGDRLAAELTRRGWTVIA